MILAALALGAGLAARTQKRFHATFDSPEALASEVLRAVEAQDRVRLDALPLGEREFREEVYPEMPAARSIPSRYAWDDLRQKSHYRLGHALARHGGRRYELERVVLGRSTAYETFVVHRKPALEVRDLETGERRRLALIGSILEHRGRYKLFSYVGDR